MREKLISFGRLQPYEAHFGVKNDDIGPENTCFWNISLE
jgi:hypothetical protein